MATGRLQLPSAIHQREHETDDTYKKILLRPGFLSTAILLFCFVFEMFQIRRLRVRSIQGSTTHFCKAALNTPVVIFQSPEDIMNRLEFLAKGSFRSIIVLRTALSYYHFMPLNVE